jgi:hypothetical protein
MRYRIISLENLVTRDYVNLTLAGFSRAVDAIAVCKRVGGYVVDSLTGETLYKRG